MGLFRGGDDGPADRARRLAGFDARELAVAALPIVATFDASRFGVHGPTAAEVAERLAPGKLGAQVRLELVDAVAEALQLLEHGRLVRHDVRISESPSLEFVATRLGRDAVRTGDVARHLGG